MERITVPEHLSGEALREWAELVTVRLAALEEMLDEDVLELRIREAVRRGIQNRTIPPTGLLGSNARYQSP